MVKNYADSDSVNLIQQGAIICWQIEHKAFSCFYVPSWYLVFKVNNWNTGEMYEICSKLTIETLERVDLFKVNNKDTKPTSLTKSGKVNTAQLAFTDSKSAMERPAQS